MDLETNYKFKPPWLHDNPATYFLFEILDLYTAILYNILFSLKSIQYGIHYGIHYFELALYEIEMQTLRVTFFRKTTHLTSDLLNFIRVAFLIFWGKLLFLMVLLRVLGALSIMFAIVRFS